MQSIENTIDANAISIKKIIELVEISGKQKIEFKPEIKIKMTPHSGPIWIDNIYKIRDQYMVTISTQQDKAPKNLDSLAIEYLTSLAIRLHSLFGK